MQATVFNQFIWFLSSQRGNTNAETNNLGENLFNSHMMSKFMDLSLKNPNIKLIILQHLQTWAYLKIIILLFTFERKLDEYLNQEKWGKIEIIYSNDKLIYYIHNSNIKSSNNTVRRYFKPIVPFENTTPIFVYCNYSFSIHNIGGNVIQ